MAEPEDFKEEVKSFKGLGRRKAAIIAVLGAVAAIVTSVIVPLVKSYQGRASAVKPNTEEVLKALKAESERQSKDIRQVHEDMIEMRSWLKGYLQAQGIKIKDPPDVPVPPEEDVKINPHPTHPKRTVMSPAPEVVTPLPVPRPLSRAKEIPEPMVPTSP